MGRGPCSSTERVADFVGQHLHQVVLALLVVDGTTASVCELLQLVVKGLDAHDDVVQLPDWIPMKRSDLRPQCFESNCAAVVDVPD